ncbi:MAG: four helix bundle protein [Thermomicrobiales bacterium]
MSSYRDLRVWQAGMDLVEEIYRLSELFPKHELYGLTSQLRRAAVSVPSNIAEGHTRDSTREYIRHVSIARGSLAEVDTQLEIAFRLGYCAADNLERLRSVASPLGRQLIALRSALLRTLEESIKNAGPVP